MMSMFKIHTIIAFAVGLSAFTAVAVAEQDINRAVFNADGSVQAPDNYNKWVHVGSVVTPDELNGGAAIFPNFHSVYIEPSAYDTYLAQGKWPDGTQIIKERTLVRKGDECNKKTGACSEVSGTGYFMGGFKGLELGVKDTKRFSKEPGGWAYFSFGNDGKPYAKTAKAFPTEKCNICHESAAESDFVFTQFYPMLRKKDK